MLRTGRALAILRTATCSTLIAVDAGNTDFSRNRFVLISISFSFLDVCLLPVDHGCQSASFVCVAFDEI